MEHEYAVDFGIEPFRFIHWNIQAVFLKKWQKMFELFNFKSKPKNNPFAPEWNNYIAETTLKNINTNKLAIFLRKKKKKF